MAPSPTSVVVDPAPAVAPTLERATARPAARRAAPAVIDLRDADAHRARRRFRTAVVLVVLLGAVLRLASLPAGAPYPSYVDEGHVLIRSDHMVAGPTWDPAWYRYPSLVPATIGAATLAVSTVDPDLRRDAEEADASPYYDLVSPGSLLVGRLLVWATSVATILLTALLARRVAGRTVALVAAVLVAVLPAFVSRGAIVIVDTPATFFTVAAAVAAAAIAGARRPWLLAAASGACAGMAATSKYNAGAALIIPLVAAALVRGAPWRRRIGLAATAVVAAGATAVVTMPALVVHPGRVVLDVASQARIYATKVGRETYLAEMGSADEVGWLLFGLGVVGLVLLLRRPIARSATIGWLAFAAATVGVALASAYQPFRNLLAVLPFLVIGAAVSVVAGARWLSERIDRRAVTTRRLAVVATGAIAALVLATGTVPWMNTVAEVDSRTSAVDWLAAHTAPGDRVLVAEELVVAPWELERIPADVEVRPVVGPDATTDVAGYDLVVTARWRDPEPGGLDPGAIAAVATFGKSTVSPTISSWRTGQAPVVIGRPRVPPDPAS